MTITLGDNPLTQVKILEVGGKPPLSPPPPSPSPKLEQVTQYTNAPKQSLPGEQTLDLVDPKIIKIPQGLPKKSTTEEHFGLQPTRRVSPSTSPSKTTTTPSSPSYNPGPAPSIVEDALNGVAMGLVDAFLDPNAKDYRDNPYLAEKSYQYERGSYQVGLESGKALRRWLLDRKKDIKTWIKDLTKPKSHPEQQDRPRPEPTPQPGPAPKPPPEEPEKPINWPDIFPDFPTIPFPEPNFDRFAPEFDFDEYKKRKPNKKKDPDPKPEKKDDSEFFPGYPYPPQPFDNPDQVRIPSIDTKDEGEIFDSPVNLTITVKHDYEDIHLYFPRDGVARSRPVIRNITAPSYTSTYVRQDVNEIKKFFFRSNNSRTSTFGTYWQYRVGNRWVYIGPGESWTAGDYTKPSISFNFGFDGRYVWPIYGGKGRVTWSPTFPPRNPETEPPTKKKEEKVEKCLFNEEKIKKIIRSLKAKIEIPVVEAVKKNVNGSEIWVPKINRTQVEVIAIDENTAASVALLYRKIAEIQIDLIKMRNQEPPIAVIPEWWQVRIGSDRPQLVCLYAEKLPNGKLGRTRWPLTIPHYNGGKKPNLPSYRKGQWEGILTLADNSKVIVNASSKEEAERVINALKQFINPAKLANSQIKVGIRKGATLKQCLVVPRSVRFFKTGQKNTVPEWVNLL